MKEWVYPYQGKLSIGLKDQLMMICFLTFMTEQQWMSAKVCQQLKAWVVAWQRLNMHNQMVLKNGKCLDLIHSMKSFITWICIINEFIYIKQVTDDVGHTSKIVMVAENRGWLYGMEMDSYKSQILDGVLVQNEIVQASVSNCMRQCLNDLVLNIHIPAYLGSRGKPFYSEL